MTTEPINLSDLLAGDRELAECLSAEEARQRDSLEMVASESMQPRTALALAGSAFNNKTAVGRVGKQRLLGSENADRLERLTAERACAIFGADHANLTTYSGSVANFCAYASVLQPGDSVLALEPACGAHQSHGGKNNISSRLYRFDYFGLDPETLAIDYAGAERKAADRHPKLLVIGSAAYPRRLDYERLADVAHRNGAYLMVDIAHFTGLVAAGESPNPVPYADIVTGSTTKTMCGPHSGFLLCTKELAEAVENGIYPGYVASLHLQTIAAMAYALNRSQTAEFKALMHRVVENASALSDALQQEGFGVFTGGTDCHMLLAELHAFGVDGVRFADRLEQIGITTNSKGIPYDPSPVAMGVRMGTTVLSQRGMGKREMAQIARIMGQAARASDNDPILADLAAEVSALAKSFPIPPEYAVAQ